jgi:signal transduction histidine kinase
MHAVAVEEASRLRTNGLPRGWWFAAVGVYSLLAIDIAGHAQQGGGTVHWVWCSKIAVFFAGALWTWGWRVRRMGLLWIATATGITLTDLLTSYPDSQLATTLGLIALWNAGSFEVHFQLAYPTGTLDSRWARWFVIWGLYVPGAVATLPVLFLEDDPPSFFYVGHTVGWLDAWNWWWTFFFVVTTPLLIALFIHKYVRASRAGRRTIGPFLLVVSLANITWAIFQCFTTLAGRVSVYHIDSYSFAAYGYAITLAALFGLLTTRRARGVVGDLVVDLGRARPGGVREALARAIGDPTLELALWVPPKNGWVDEQGRDVELPVGPDRAVTLIGDKLAAIAHDPVLLDQPALLEAAGSAARFALENERLHAELRAQLEELRESRARIVRAGDEERRRLERDLHDGAQQRLLGLGMALQLLGPHVDEESRPLLAETEAELQHALVELRELARGIHPAVLTEQGLDAAVRTLAARSPLPVQVDACGERLPEPVETAAYFVVSEALTNIARYAHATKAEIRIGRNTGNAHIEIHDNGVGGANPHNGSGLNGLADRIAALEGQLRIDSPAGAGTTITADIPCTP